MATYRELEKEIGKYRSWRDGLERNRKTHRRPRQSTQAKDTAWQERIRTMGVEYAPVIEQYEYDLVALLADNDVPPTVVLVAQKAQQLRRELLARSRYIGSGNTPWYKNVRLSGDTLPKGLVDRTNVECVAFVKEQLEPYVRAGRIPDATFDTYGSNRRHRHVTIALIMEA